MHQIKIFLVLLAITVVGGFLRFYQLDKYPVQLNHDEISQLYDTASIVQTKKDIYSKFLPLAFPSTGEFKVGHYIYITVLSYLVFGMREITIRIPAAFFGTLIIPAVFLFINQLAKNWRLALLSAAAITITPSEIFYSRKSFENIIGIFFVFSGLFLLLRELNNKGKFGFILTPVFLSLAMYIYTSHTIVVPFVVITFAVMFWKKILMFRKRFLMMVIIWILLTLPLVYITLTNPGIRFRAETVSLFQDQSLSHQLQNFENNNTLSSTIYKIKVISEYSFTKYLNQFNPIRIFLNGLDLTNQGLIGMGPLLFLQLPLFILGMIYTLKSSFFVNNGKFLLAILFLAMIPSGITYEEFSPHRSVWAFSIMSIISSFGFFWLFQLVQSIKTVIIKAAIIALLGTSLIINFIYFFHIYTVNFPFEKSQNMHYPYKQISLFVWSRYDSFNQIIVDPVYGQSAPVRAVAVQYYLAYYGKYPPDKFQKDLRIDKLGMHFDKFSVREINWSQDKLLKNALIISSPWSIPINDIDENTIIKRFNFYDGQLAFYAIAL